jgi:hypothetical protein
LRRNRRRKGFRSSHGHRLHGGLAVPATVGVTHRRSCRLRGWLSHRRRRSSTHPSERVLVVRRLRGRGWLSVGRRRRRSTVPILWRRRLRSSHSGSVRWACSRWWRSPKGRRLPRHIAVRVTSWRKRRLHINRKLIERVGHDTRYLMPWDRRQTPNSISHVLSSTQNPSNKSPQIQS